MDTRFAMTIGYISNSTSYMSFKTVRYDGATIKPICKIVLTKSANPSIISSSELIEVLQAFYFVDGTFLKLNC